MTRRCLLPLLSLLFLPAKAGDARTPIAVFRDWGAFRDDDPLHCFAIAEPPPGTGAPAGDAWAAVTSWPARRIRAQLSVRLSRGHAAGAAVTLTVGEASFKLVADARTAWAASRLADAQIVAAMRSGSTMSIATVAPSGRAYADVYRLRGAATAIDAATLACPLDRP